MSGRREGANVCRAAPGSGVDIAYML